ncbi:MAG: tetraacyldisaccharide 4'-kinase [Nitrospirae bacterium]|nr:MAG: tetraacyldisaccharide 4'-kinase [Nitrospirota bacterium]
MWLLRLLSIPYGLVVRARAWLYATGWFPTWTLPCRVVSVGNLTAGGTGKTPVVIWLVQSLLLRGLRVGVLSRGYKRQSGEEFLLVSDGETVLAGPAEAGDEPHLIASRCPGVVVAVGADRYRAGQWVLSRFPLDCVVLDDGFQHLALHRDVNLLLVDASAPQDLDALLPAGRLREPLAAAARATLVLMTRVDQVRQQETVAGTVRALGRRDQPILVRFTPDMFVDVASGAAQALEGVRGRTALLFSGIGNSGSFRATMSGLGVNVVEEVRFPDHHAYRNGDLERVNDQAKRCGAQLLVTTEKDAVKVAPLLRPGERVLALRLGTDIVDGRERMERVVFGGRELA